MERIEHIDEKGRKYAAYSNGTSVIIIGPPEGVVDELKLPEPFATNLHNALYSRGIYTFKDATNPHNGMIGVLQEALMIDVQKLIQAYYIFENM